MFNSDGNTEKGRDFIKGIYDNVKETVRELGMLLKVGDTDTVLMQSKERVADYLAKLSYPMNSVYGSCLPPFTNEIYMQDLVFW